MSNNFCKSGVKLFLLETSVSVSLFIFFNTFTYLVFRSTIHFLVRQSCWGGDVASNPELFKFNQNLGSNLKILEGLVTISEKMETKKDILLFRKLLLVLKKKQKQFCNPCVIEHHIRYLRNRFEHFWFFLGHPSSFFFAEIIWSESQPYWNNSSFCLGIFGDYQSRRKISNVGHSWGHP